MPTLLTGATLLDLEPASVERADLRVADGLILERAPSLEPQPDEEVVDLTGKLVLPGLVSAHHRLSALALRGRPYVSRAGLLAFEAGLSSAERAALATAAGLEGLQAGVTTVFHVHGPSRKPERALPRTAHGLSSVGVRAVLACEVSDAGGAVPREEALEACGSWASAAHGRFRGAYAFTDIASLGDDALAGLAEARARSGAMLLGALARQPQEEAESLARFGATPVDRLLQAGLVGEFSALAANVHLSWPQLNQLLAQGPYLVHTPRTNMLTQTGVATAAKFGVHSCLGTDLASLDVLAEGQAALLRNLDAEQPLDLLHLLASGQRLAGQAFGLELGPLREGAAADLVVLDYLPPTPLDAASLASHLLLGLSTRAVESVMVDGLWRLWKRRALGVEEAEVAQSARDAARSAWARV